MADARAPPRRGPSQIRRNARRILVTGASGLLGRALMRAFGHDELHVVGVARRRAGAAAPPLGSERVQSPETRGCVFDVDLVAPAALERLLADFQPHVIVHAAAIRAPDLCVREPGLTAALNVESTRRLAKWAYEASDCVMVLISTDYVFDGKSPPYRPNAPLSPLNAYGRSKAESEQALWASGHSGLVLRVPLLYGPVETLDESAATGLFASVLAAQARDAPPQRLDDDAVRFPTHVDDVAAVCLALAERRWKHCGLSGTFHFSATQAYTKLGMAREMARAFGLDESRLEAAPPASAEAAGAAEARPHNAQLDCSALNMMMLGPSTPTSFAAAIRGILEPFYAQWLRDAQRPSS